MLLKFHLIYIYIYIYIYSRSKPSLTIILNFCVGTIIAIHALPLSCHPFLPCLVYLINSFMQMDYTSLMEIKVRPSQTLELFVQC